MAESTFAADANLIASFLAKPDISDISRYDRLPCVIIYLPEVFFQAEQLFRAMESNPRLAKVVVIVGVDVHSPGPLRNALANHPTYHSIAASMTRRDDFEILQKVLDQFFDMDKIMSRGCKLLYHVEDRSKDCGFNAAYIRMRVEDSGVLLAGQRCVVIQDPTRLRRTIASLEKAYGDKKEFEDSRLPDFRGCPTFVPKIHGTWPDIEYDVPGISSRELWPNPRFVCLLMREMQRLGDDSDGDGPNGNGFIAQVTIPSNVEAANERLCAFIKERR